MEILACPSCAGKIQLIKCSRYFCEACDAIFRITREGPKIETVGALDSLTERVGNIEQQIGKSSLSEDPKPPLPATPREAVEDPEDLDDDEIDEVAGDDDVNELWGD